MARPAVLGLGKAFEAGGAKPFDAAEAEGGTLAIAAVFYQYGASIDARIIAAMWLFGVSISRVPDLVKTYRAGREPKTIPATPTATQEAPK